VANTAALKLAGVTADTKDPPGGVVYRSADGKTPSGVLKDNAMSLVERLVPQPDEREIREAIRAALAAAAEVGVTSVQDMDGSSAETRRRLFRVFQKLARDDKLTCRIDLRWPIGVHKELAAVGVTAEFGSDFLRVGGVKGFMDGSLGSSTAKMFDPYDSDPKTSGVFVTEPDTMRSLVRSADAAGLNVCVHAIGDQANATLLPREPSLSTALTVLPTVAMRSCAPTPSSMRFPVGSRSGISDDMLNAAPSPPIFCTCGVPVSLAPAVNPRHSTVSPTTETYW